MSVAMVKLLQSVLLWLGTAPGSSPTSCRSKVEVGDELLELVVAVLYLVECMVEPLDEQPFTLS